MRGSKNNKNLITIATRVSIVLVAISYLFDHPGITFILSNIFMALFAYELSLDQRIKRKYVYLVIFLWISSSIIALIRIYF
ncbi:MAG: hypothetical protein GX769_04360 [Erysipelothrix sp.]|nr:hypothetical protein [Erysipelothrix sp.]